MEQQNELKIYDWKNLSLELNELEEQLEKLDKDKNENENENENEKNFNRIDKVKDKIIANFNIKLNKRLIKQNGGNHLKYRVEVSRLRIHETTPGAFIIFTLCITMPDATDKKVKRQRRIDAMRRKRAATKLDFKVHVSLDCTTPNNFFTGFNIIKDILMQHNVAKFKAVCHPYFCMEKIKAQAGKNITIYVAQEKDFEKSEKYFLKWKQILKIIEDKLSQLSIKPGKVISGTKKPNQSKWEKQLGNSKFMYFRHEKAYNKGDIFSELDIDISKEQCSIL